MSPEDQTRSATRRDSKAPDSVDPLVEEVLHEFPGKEIPFAGVFTRLARITELEDQALSALLARFSLRSGDLGVLTAIRRSGPPYQLSAGRLAELLLRSSTAISGRIDRLSSLGLVERLPDPGDRRTIFVRLTAYGYRVQEEAFGILLEHRGQLLSNLSAEQLAELNAILRTILHTLESRTEGTLERDDHTGTHASGQSQ